MQSKDQLCVGMRVAICLQPSRDAVRASIHYVRNHVLAVYLGGRHYAYRISQFGGHKFLSDVSIKQCG